MVEKCRNEDKGKFKRSSAVAGRKRGGEGGGGVNRGFTISNLATIVSSVENLQLHNDF